LTNQMKLNIATHFP